ncbi:hypothetical protein NLI96_g8186 [Meripilus lineatus]|uniref:ClpP/crotonase n=1 Tax=Meripilus lineatus TaxID=2056292 RepID=A0AAD5V2H3_9APHY|nr:hypothetical protein NLI96_g8186 [Physisporinus lineatus]
MSIPHLSGKLIQVSSPSPHVLLVELARAPVNAFNKPFWVEYGKVFEKISREQDVRAVVLASSLPKVFSAGLDFSALSEFQTFDSDIGRRAVQTRDFILEFQHAVSAPERCPIPVIIAIHGVAYGLPIDILGACDEVDIGLASDIGTLARLPKLTGNQSLVHELAYTARPFSANEAEKMGLVSKVVEGGRDEVVKAALETAKVIAAKSPIAIVGTKRTLLHSRDHTVQENLEYVATWNAAMLHSTDVAESIKAAQAKKRVTYKPLGRSAKL